MLVPFQLDSKQIAYFDRMHGFQCLAVQLSYHSDGCTEAIIQGLLSLIFWQRNKRRISSSNGSDGSDKRLSTSSTVSSVASTEDDEGFFPIKTSTSPINSRPNSMELRRNQLAPTAPGPESAASSPSATAATAVPVAATSTTPNCAVPPASVSVPVPVPVSVSVSVLTTPTAAATATEDVKAGVKDTAPPVSQQHPKTAVADQAPAASSGSLLSLFSWGGSSAATTAPAKSSSAPPALVVVESVVGNSAAKLESKSASSAEYQPGELLATSSTNDLEGAQARSSQGVAVESAVSSPSEHETTEDRTVKSIHQQQHHQADDTRTSVNHKLYLVDVMEVPQALEALFKVLQNSKSIDQVAGTFKVIEQSVTCTSVTTSLHRELSAATNVLHQRNAESFFAQKDWLVWMCDLLVQFSRQAMNAEEHEGNTSVFSLSESESVGAGSYYGGNVDLELSEGESEDSNSLAGDCLSEDHNPPHGHNSSGNRSGYKSSVGSADSLSGRVTAWQQHLVDQYSNPIYTLVRKLLLQDMVSNKPSSVRRWNELFRISMPELNGIQERLLEDLFGVMQNLSEFCEDTNSTLNVLKNIASLLEQALEKADLSLPFCVKVVQALHSLAYNCAPEIRSRIKETSVLEIRKNYVVRCLLDNTQDYYTKVAAISEIASPLQGYISSTDSKPLSDVNVVMMVLGMLVEACEDLEFLLGGVDSSEVMLCESATSTAKGPGMVDDIRFIGSPVPASTSDRVHILFEVLEVLIESAQNCVLSSAECRKCVTKLVSNIPGDAHAHCLAAFLKAFGAKARQSAGGGTTPAGSSQQGGEAGGAAATDMDSTKASTGGGSGGGGGSLSRSNTFTGASSSSTGAQGSYTWWGGWSAAPTTGDATITAASTGDTAVATHSAAASASKDSAVESDIEANRTQDISGQQTPTQNQIVERPRAVSLDDAAPPMNIRSFISWFCSFDQRYHKK